MNKITDLQRNRGDLVVRVVVSRLYAPWSNPVIFDWIFSFKIEETYTSTTFVDQKLSLSVYSKSTYDSLVWLRFFDLSKLLKKKSISDCRSLSVLKILTGYRPHSRSLSYFRSKFPSVLRGNHASSIRTTSPKFMYHIYQKLNITALQNCLNWCLICGMVDQVNVVFSFSFLKPTL